MPQKSGFLPAPAEYYAADMAGFLTAHHPNGVLRGYGSEMTVTAVSASPGVIRLNVGTGLAMVNGYWVESYGAGTELDLDTPDASPRIDSIVAKWTSSGTAVITVHKGTPAASPTAPTLLDSATETETLIRNYLVNPGDTQSSPSPSRYSGTPDRSEAPWASNYAPLASPNFSGLPTIGGQQILHTGLMPRTTFSEFNRSIPAGLYGGSSSAQIFYIGTGITIPSWATRLSLDATVDGLQGSGGTVDARLFFSMNGVNSSATGWRIGPVLEPYFRDGVKDRAVNVIGATGSIGAAYRGTNQTLWVNASKASGAGVIEYGSGAYGMAKITWIA